jgi:hypothetical protein
MLPFKRFLLAILILFGALNPSVYADCCALEKEEESCCSLKERTASSNVADNAPSSGCHAESESNCHTNKITQIAGVQYYSCCVHLPDQFLNDFTTPTQERVQNPIQPKSVLSVNVVAEIIHSSFIYSRMYPGSFGSFHSPPGWLSFRNIRC